MQFKRKLLISSILLGAFIASGAATAKPLKNGKFGVGLITSGTFFGSFGLSAKKELTNEISAEAILGFLGTYTNFGAKGIYKFQKDAQYDLYGYGSLSYWSYSSHYYYGSRGYERTTGIGFGAGAGIEYDVAKDITVNGELGFNAVNWDHGYSGMGYLNIGLAAHYWF